MNAEYDKASQWVCRAAWHRLPTVLPCRIRHSLQVNVVRRNSAQLFNPLCAESLSCDTLNAARVIAINAVAQGPDQFRAQASLASNATASTFLDSLLHTDPPAPVRRLVVNGREDMSLQ
jgi:hypothetical protein